MEVKVFKTPNFDKRVKEGKIVIIKDLRSTVSIDGKYLGLHAAKHIVDAFEAGHAEETIVGQQISIADRSIVGISFEMDGGRKIPLFVRIKQLAKAALKADETQLAEDLLAVFNKHYG